MVGSFPWGLVSSFGFVVKLFSEASLMLRSLLSAEEYSNFAAFSRKKNGNFWDSWLCFLRVLSLARSAGKA